MIWTGWGVWLSFAAQLVLADILEDMRFLETCATPSYVCIYAVGMTMCPYFLLQPA
jgi:hypothetical protein